MRFAPTDPAAHAVTLEIASAGSSAAVLLLGEAQVPGSLVLAAAASSSATFGDVPVGTNVTRSYTLQNPGQVPSGRLAISSDNNRFELIPGDCNQGDPAGLVDGASCAFSVRFTPNDNLPQVANLSVQSPGAGRAGLQVNGRGRFPATLSATGNRDLGRANIGQAGLTQPQNEFTWTINNQGDLSTEILTVQNDNPTEFQIRNDSCSNSAIAGRSSCQMIIRFLPSAAGNRTGRVVVNDPANGRSITLALTGLGVQLANLGASCVNATCAQGTCTRGVCCDVACDRTCQVCSAEGRCINQSSREACGNGAACFGVDNCKLPEGRACSANGGDAQCGSGNCERRLGGTGNADRICCLDDCGDSLQCNTQNRCQAPTLGAGAQCGRPGDLPCGGGLECKACLGSNQRQCTPPDACCGGCPGEEVCTAGSCACPVQNNGLQQVPCGGGRCIQNRLDACCDTATGCSGNDVCDPLTDLCGCPSGTRDCGNNRCVSANQCCEDCPATGRDCVGGSCQCPGGRPFINGQCRLNAGEQCSPNGVACAQGSCRPAVDGGNRCCPGNCGTGQLCNAQGMCIDPARLTGVPAQTPGIAFGTLLVTSSTTATWQITNAGGLATGTLTASETPTSADFSMNTLNCPALGAGQSCSVVVTFSPQSSGPKSTTLALQAANGGAVVRLNVSGTGQQRVLVGESNALPDTQNYSPNFLTARGVTVSAAAQLSSFGVITREGGSQVRIGLYRDSDVLPEERVAQTPPTLLQAGRQEISISPVQLAAGDYWIVTQFDATTPIAVQNQSFVTAPYVDEPVPFSSGLPANFLTAGTVLRDALPRANFYLVLLQ